MEKDFDRWNGIKKATDAADETAAALFSRRRDLVGATWEKHRLRDRRQEPRIHPSRHHSQKVQPILIPCASLTTAPKPNSYRLPIGIVDGEQAFATLSQLRNIDSKRLVKKIVHLDADILAAIKKEASRVNFG